MSENRTVLVVGAGYMGIEHSKVLKALGCSPLVVGRSLDRCIAFEEKTELKAIPGGIETYVNTNNDIPEIAIVAVSIPELASTAELLMGKGVKKILLEKPGGMNRLELESLLYKAEEFCCEIFLAYNRRFYVATQKANELIAEDGGVSSFNFEFTEWSSTIEKLNDSATVKDIWLLANSSHVIDLAFFLGGYPAEMDTFVAGGLSWHKNGSVYAGAGVSEKGALFSYQANWGAPGRWGVEILTPKRRLIFRPLEKLQVQLLNSLQAEFYELDDEIDRMYKPGLFKQAEAFLNGNTENLLSLRQYVEHFDIYERIGGVQEGVV